MHVSWHFKYLFYHHIIALKISTTKKYDFQVSNEIAENAVISPVSGYIYEKRLLLKYVKENGTDPMTNEALNPEQLIEVKCMKVNLHYDMTQNKNRLIFLLFKLIHWSSQNHHRPQVYQPCWRVSRTNGTRSCFTASPPDNSCKLHDKNYRMRCTSMMPRVVSLPALPKKSQLLVRLWQLSNLMSQPIQAVLQLLYLKL